MRRPPILPEMTDQERKWYDACPKGILYAVARRLASNQGEDVVEILNENWSDLHAEGKIAQRPIDFEARRKRELSRKRLLEQRAIRTRLYWARAANGNAERETDFIERYGVRPSEVIEAARR